MMPKTMIHPVRARLVEMLFGLARTTWKANRDQAHSRWPEPRRVLLETLRLSERQWSRYRLGEAAPLNGQLLDQARALCPDAHEWQILRRLWYADCLVWHGLAPEALELDALICLEDDLRRKCMSGAPVSAMLPVFESVRIWAARMALPTPSPCIEQALVRLTAASAEAAVLVESFGQASNGFAFLSENGFGVSTRAKLARALLLLKCGIRSAHEPSLVEAASILQEFAGTDGDHPEEERFDWYRGGVLYACAVAALGLPGDALNALENAWFRTVPPDFEARYRCGLLRVMVVVLVDTGCMDIATLVHMKLCEWYPGRFDIPSFDRIDYPEMGKFYGFPVVEEIEELIREVVVRKPIRNELTWIRLANSVDQALCAGMVYHHRWLGLLVAKSLGTVDGAISYSFALGPGRLAAIRADPDHPFLQLLAKRFSPSFEGDIWQA